MVKNLAIIPARGGSKRIPGKNIIDFKGKPMILWTIEAALNSGVFDAVMVSTDDPEIAAIAVSHGALVPELREAYADDHASVSKVIQYELEKWKIREGYFPNTITSLMPNCPLRAAQDIQQMFAQFKAQKSPYLLSASSYAGPSPRWAHCIDNNGKTKALFPEALLQRSQDLEDLYSPSGAIWIADTIAFLKDKSFYGPGYRFFPLGEIAAWDIDTLTDLAIAQSFYSLKEIQNLTS